MLHGSGLHGRPAGRALAALCAALTATAVAGCGAGAAESEARSAADAFLEAAGADPASACERLAPETRSTLEENAGSSCDAALRQLGLGATGAAESVDVAGHGAQVRYASDTVFLALFDDGWLVTAAGCDRASDDRSEPYDCDVEGG